MSRVLAKKESGRVIWKQAPPRGLVHLNVAAMAVHYLGHHGEADTLAGGAIGAHPRWKISPDLPGRCRGRHPPPDAQAVVLVADMDPDLADGELAGVVEQVAHQLHQIALLAVEEDIVIELEAGLQLLVAIDLGEAGQQLLDERYRLGALARKGACDP